MIQMFLWKGGDKSILPPGTSNSNLVGGPCPLFFQLSRGGQNCPRTSNYWGRNKNLKIPIYLVPKGEFFSIPLKTVFYTFHEGFPEFLLKVQKSTFIAFLSHNLPEIVNFLSQKLLSQKIYENIFVDFEKLQIS